MPENPSSKRKDRFGPSGLVRPFGSKFRRRAETTGNAVGPERAPENAVESNDGVGDTPERQE